MKLKANSNISFQKFLKASFLKITKYSFFIWILSIVVFFLSLLPPEKPFSTFTNIVSYTALSVGIVSFLVFAFSITKLAVKLLLTLSKKHGHLFKSISLKYFVIGIFILLLLITYQFYQQNADTPKTELDCLKLGSDKRVEACLKLLKQDKPQEEITTSPVTEMKTDVSPPVPEPTSKQVKGYLPTPTADPDPVVDCQFKNLGSRKTRSSECNKSFECQVNNQWYIYTSSDKCNQDQDRDTSTKWSQYRAARIKDLQGALQVTNESNAKSLQDLEKWGDYLEEINTYYEKDLITYEKYKTMGNEILPAINELSSWIKENQKKVETLETLIRRFENGENVSLEEYKAILDL